MPPQEQNWELPPAKPLMVPCFLSSCCAAVMAILPGMTAAQATVVVMTVRNFWGRLTDPDYIPADFEYGPGGINDPAARARIAEYRAESARLHGLDDSRFDDNDWDNAVGENLIVIGDDHVFQNPFQAESVDGETE